MEVAYPDELMSDPRYRPRRYTSEPAAFGKAANIQWGPVASGSEDQADAAKMQHFYAKVIADEAKRQYGSIKRYARVAGVDYQRLTKILRGEAVMRFEDIASARRQLGDAIPFPPIFKGSRQ